MDVFRFLRLQTFQCLTPFHKHFFRFRICSECLDCHLAATDALDLQYWTRPNCLARRCANDDKKGRLSAPSFFQLIPTQ